MAAADPASKAPTSATLPGVARILVMAGMLTQQAAEDIFRKAQASQRNFLAEVTL